MFKVIDKPDSGKTRKLLEECAKNHGLFVCAHPERVFDKCKAYGIELVSACSYEQYIYDYDYKSNWDIVYIDELDKFLLELSNMKVWGYSLTVDD